MPGGNISELEFAPDGASDYSATQTTIYRQPYVTDRPPSAGTLSQSLGAVTMLRDVRFAFGFLALVIAGSAKAQGDLDQGKTAAQLYASACATCHKSPQSISKTKWFFGLESFLRQHYTSSSESAAILAGYLKKQAAIPAESQHSRGTRHLSKVSSPVPSPTVNEIGEEIPRPPADIPNVRP